MPWMGRGRDRETPGLGRGAVRGTVLCFLWPLSSSKLPLLPPPGNPDCRIPQVLKFTALGVSTVKWDVALKTVFPLAPAP